MKLLVLLVIVFISSETSAKPFLFSTSKWIFQRLFSSNSSADHGTTNIEDLAEEGPIFHHNEHANKTNKSNDENDGNSEVETQVVDLTGSRRTNSEQGEAMNETNEKPGILHRKISKILNKLQLYSAVRSTIHNVRRQQNGGDEAEPNESNESESNESSTKLQRTVNLQYLPSQNATNSTQELDDTSDSDNEENVDFDERYDEPFVFDDELEAKEHDNKNADTSDTGNKLSLENGNIGVHIMEIVGSIATIFLTAAYQVGMYANSFTSGSNQALVTSQLIEGTGTTIKWKIN